jgi:ABC-type nitrate/sulfonate/bicarbonate transport system permease component
VSEADRRPPARRPPGGGRPRGGGRSPRVAWLKSHPNAIRATAVAAFFVFWEYAARDMSPLFMTYPSAILRAAWQITASGELPRAFAASMGPFVVGLAISIVGGILIGIVIAQFWLLEYALDPFINALYAIPRVALVPLIILWAGLEGRGKVTILVSIAIFPVIINTYAGIKDVRGGLIEIGRAYGATERQIFTKIVLPASVPYIMAGIRLAVGLAIIGMIVAEFFTAITGLGGLIVTYSNSFATAKLFVPIIVVGLLGVGLTELVMFAERRLSRWRALERERF